MERERESTAGKSWLSLVWNVIPVRETLLFSYRRLGLALGAFPTRDLSRLARKCHSLSLSSSYISSLFPSISLSLMSYMMEEDYHLTGNYHFAYSYCITHLQMYVERERGMNIERREIRSIVA